MIIAIQQNTSIIGVELVTKSEVADKDDVKVGEEIDPTRDVFSRLGTKHLCSTYVCCKHALFMGRE